MVRYMAVFLCLAMCVQRLSMAAGNILYVLSILCFLWYVFKNKNNGKLVLTEDVKGYYKVILILLVSMVPSVIFSENIGVSTKAFFEMWVYRTMPFFIITLCIKEKEILTKMFIAFVVAESIDCLVALGQLLMGMANRGWGFGNNVLNLPALLSMLIPMVMIVALDDRFSSKLRKIFLLGLACLVIGMLAGKSRGLWLTILGVSPFVLYRYAVNDKKKMVALLVVIASLGAFFISQPKYVHRVKSITNVTTDRSNADRLVVWESSWNMIKDNTITGVGLGNYKEVYEKSYKLSEVTQNMSHSHNNFIQICSEAGVIGVCGFMYMTVFTLFTNFIDWHKNSNPYSLMLFSSWLGFTLFGMIDLTVDATAIVKCLWFLTGISLLLRERFLVKDE